MKKIIYLVVVIFTIFISSCKGTGDIQEDSSSLQKTPARIVISEVFTGVEGNNQADFVELYNAGTEIADLNGYTLYFQLNDANEEVVLYHWTEESLIPPLGYYALIQAGQLFPVQPDAIINQPLVPSRGGLSLRKGNQTIDQISWGNGPADMVEGHPALEMQLGYSLERSPAALASGGGDTDDNGVDFSLSDTPSLMYTGSPNNHNLAGQLGLEINFPYQVNPGSGIQG